MYQDKTLKCKECGNDFVFTAGEQEFYASRGFENEPSRCKDCRTARKNAQKGAREMFAAVCDIPAGSLLSRRLSGLLRALPSFCQLHSHTDNPL